MKTNHKNNERLVTRVFEDIFDKFGVELFYNADHLPGGLSAGTGDILIEDYNNKLSMDDELF